MKRLIYFMLLAVFLTTNCLPVYADGIGDNQRSDYPGVVDYRFHIVSNTSDHEKPRAGFSLQIKDPFGNLLTETIDSGNIDGRKSIVSEQDSPAIDANIGDSIIINDLSSPGSGSKITQYDIQYRFTPEGEKRENYELTYHIVNNFSEVKKIVEELKLDKPGTYEFYMEVADNASCLPGATNWSANGNLRVINTSNPNFPKGIFWYFTGAVVEVSAGSPDFYPTPEGSKEWQESYKDCAETYYYEPGQAEITFPVNLFNQGEKAITDFKAVWFNSSKVNPKPWDSSVWEAKEIDRHGGGHNPNTEKPVASPNAGGTGEATTQPEPGIKLAKGESKTFEVTVPLPVPDYAGGKLVFLCNTDGKTPASETNKENNMMIIKIEEAGVDIEAKLPDQPQIYLIDPGQTANVFVTLIVRRNDDGTKPVDTDINYSGPFGSVDKQATFTSMNSNYYDIKFSLTQPGKYYVKASAWPVGVTDIKPENNEDQCLIVVKLKEPPKTQPTKTDSDSNTRVNLRS